MRRRRVDDGHRGTAMLAAGVGGREKKDGSMSIKWARRWSRYHLPQPIGAPLPPAPTCHGAKSLIHGHTLSRSLIVNKAQGRPVSPFVRFR